VLGRSPALLYGRILPGAAVSLIVGNVFYAWQARRLAARTGRADVCALPYGGEE
jgi:AGZA family xanthine/uracil permease-like MFS transporter